jgi:hypothetical protein
MSPSPTWDAILAKAFKNFKIIGELAVDGTASGAADTRPRENSSADTILMTLRFKELRGL